MGKPAKIRKKKSFMFTTKRHSFLGWLGGLIGIVSIGTAITLVIATANAQGSATKEFGFIGLMLFLLNIIGGIAGLKSVRERDSFITMPIIGLVCNGVMILVWALLLVLSH